MGVAASPAAVRDHRWRCVAPGKDVRARRAADRKGAQHDVPRPLRRSVTPCGSTGPSKASETRAGSLGLLMGIFNKVNSLHPPNMLVPQPLSIARSSEHRSAPAALSQPSDSPRDTPGPPVPGPLFHLQYNHGSTSMARGRGGKAAPRPDERPRRPGVVVASPGHAVRHPAIRRGPQRAGHADRRPQYSDSPAGNIEAQHGAGRRPAQRSPIPGLLADAYDTTP